MQDHINRQKNVWIQKQKQHAERPRDRGSQTQRETNMASRILDTNKMRDHNYAKLEIRKKETHKNIQF